MHAEYGTVEGFCLCAFTACVFEDLTRTSHRLLCACPQASLRKCLDAQLRYLAAALVAASLPPAAAPELLAELLQPRPQPQRRPGGGGGPPRRVMGDLLELLARDGFPHRELADWAEHLLVRCMPLELRMPLAPAVSYLACRTMMLVAPDSEDRASKWVTHAGRLPGYRKTVRPADDVPRTP